MRYGGGTRTDAGAGCGAAPSHRRAAGLQAAGHASGSGDSSESEGSSTGGGGGDTAGAGAERTGGGGGGGDDGEDEDEDGNEDTGLCSKVVQAVGAGGSAQTLASVEAGVALRLGVGELDEMQRRRVGVILGILCDKRVKL